MPRDRIELSTPGFSDQCSTTELPRHYLYIIPNLFFPRKHYSFLSVARVLPKEIYYIKGRFNPGRQEAYA